MNSHRDHGAYIEYNLEAIAEILASKFKNSFVLVIRPTKMELKTFSCYSNFVSCNHIGTPSHEANHNALAHLIALLKSVAKLTGYNEVAEDAPLILIGFSKGCVVLNQFLHEIHYFNDSPFNNESNLVSEIKRLKKIMWLDGGHSGGKDTWITSPSILSSLAALNIMVDIHITPYQIKDDRRPWIGREEKQFHTVLKKLGVPLVRKTYFTEEPPTIDNHFRLLKEFA